MSTTSDGSAYSGPPSVGVVICAYTEQRWGDLVAGVRAVHSMVLDDDQLVVVVDHNEQLAQRLRSELPPEVGVLANAGSIGLSDARNTGVAAVSTDVVAFLDDDALPGPGWLAAFREAFRDPSIVAVGGAIRPSWEGGSAPRWFPPEFGWVLGCDYRGLPTNGSEIRNPIGASMAIRREHILGVGGFSAVVGRVGAKPTGNEETELCIRVRQVDPDARIIRSTESVVLHRVPKSRQTVRYFLSRCYHEGRSKARLATSVGLTDALSAERGYVARTLVSGLGMHLRDALRGERAGLARAGLVPVGLAATATGYAIGRATPSDVCSKA